MARTEILDRQFAVKDMAAADARSGQTLQRIWSEAPKPETQNLPDLFHKNPRLDPVDLIAKNISDAPILLYNREEYRALQSQAKQIQSHAFLDLMEKPSMLFPELDWVSLSYLTSTYVDLLGEFFWVKFRLGNGKEVTDIFPFLPSWCIKVPTVANETFQFNPFGTTSGKTWIISKENVVWFKHPNLMDPYGRGRGRTEAVGDELDTDEFAAKYQKNLFYNRATPAFWANIKDISGTDLIRLRDEWGNNVGGYVNSGKPAFTNSGAGIEIIKIAETAKEMQYIESRKYVRDSFNQHYSIPPELFGILEHSNRATIDSAYYLFSKNVIIPRKSFIERVITNQLIVPDFDKSLMFYIDYKIPEDEQFKLTVVNTGFQNGILSAADWKRAFNYTVVPEDEVKYINDVNPTAETPPKLPVEPPIPSAPKSYKKKYAKLEHWKAFDLKALSGESQFKQKMRSFWENQKSRVIENYKDLNKAFDGADDALKHSLASAWMASMSDGADLAYSRLGKKSYKAINPNFTKWIDTYGLQQAKKINDTTKSQIADLISEHIDAGDSVKNIGEAISDEFDDMNDSRAQTIARTETASSVNFGQQATYKTEGVEQKEWIGIDDGLERPEHQDSNGDIVGIDEPFEVGDDELLYPGDPSGSPENIINCRCTIGPVVGEL